MLNCVVSWIDSGGLVSRLSPGGLGRMVSEEIASHGLRNAPFLRPLGGGLERRHVPPALHRNVVGTKGWMDSKSHHRGLSDAALVRWTGGRCR